MGNERAAQAKLNELYEAERLRLQRVSQQADAPMGAYASPVFGEGNALPRLVLVGEAPGAEETRLGRPFVGRAGQQLSALLTLAGMSREELYVTNVVKYRPEARSARGTKNRTPGQKEIVEGLPLLERELQILKPEIVATLGNVPLMALYAIVNMPKSTVGAVHGIPQQVRLCGRELILYPLYHPASTIYNRALLPVCELDAKGLGAL